MTLSLLIQNYLDTAAERAKYKAVLDAYIADPAGDHPDLVPAMESLKAIKAPLQTTLFEMWTNSVRAASKENRIGESIENDSCTVIGEDWAKLSAKGFEKIESYKQKSFGETFTHMTISDIDKWDGFSEEKLAQLEASIENGTISRRIGDSERCRNFNDGTVLFLELDNWTLTLTDKGKKPMQSTEGFVFCTELHFPSGEALVADSVRIDPIPDIIMGDKMRQMFHINYSWPRVLRTVVTASQFNALNVSAGDDGPDMVQNDEGVLFCGRKDDAHATVASICHDYWGTVMIDRGQTADLMVEHGAAASIEEAQTIIQEWLDESPHHNSVKVAKGTYKVYWDDDRESLDASLKAHGIKSPENTQLVLTQTPLDMPNAKLRDLCLKT